MQADVWISDAHATSFFRVTALDQLDLNFRKIIITIIFTTLLWKKLC